MELSLTQTILVINLSCILTIVLLNIVLLFRYYKPCIKIRCFPLIYWLVMGISHVTITKQKVYKTIRYLNICEDSVMYTRRYYCKKYSLVLMIFLMANVSAIAVMYGTKSQNQLINNTELVRPAYNENGKSVSLDVSICDKNGIKKDANIDIKLEPNRLNTFEEARLIAQVKEYLDIEVIGDNKSCNHVYKALNLVERYNKDKNIGIDWKLDEDGIIEYDGKINQIYLKKRELR